MRCVVDTNVFVSAAMFAHSVPRRAVKKALRDGALLFSDGTMDELRDVLFRPKMDRYVSREDRLIFLAQLRATAEFVPVIQLVRECRDPRDDKFLEVALNGRADVIITGDADLLALHPWRRIAILSPTDFLRR
ncbi:MAG: putative toxin-antitoxin system toxin component, PIN family [Terriglobales bacterium]